MGWVIPAKLMRNLLGGEEVVIQSATLFKISAMVLCDCGTWVNALRHRVNGQCFRIHCSQLQSVPKYTENLKHANVPESDLASTVPLLYLWYY